MFKEISAPIFVPFLLLLLLTGCLPGSEKGSSKLRSGLSASPSAGGSSTPTAGSDADLFWYSGKTNAGKTLIVNANTKTSAYLRGTKISSYLNSSYSPTTTDSSAFFCMVITFNVTSSGGKNQLRLRAIPDTFKTGTDVERLFRIDFEQSSLNQATCAGTVNGIVASDATYSPLSVCPNCTRNFSSNVNSIKLYLVQNNSLSDSSVVKPIYLDTTLLNLRIDGSNSTTDDNNSLCTPGKCEDLKYDCCVEGQCVNKGQMRSNASTFSDFAQAQADVALNFSNYTLYPHIYYSCPGAVLPTPGATPTGDLSEEALARFKLHKQYYLCLLDAAKCIDPLIPTPQTQANVDSLVQKMCGCTNTVNPTLYCNKFGLEALYPTNILVELRKDSDITEIKCKVINLSAEPTPFQTLDRGVPSRSAPHRFFKTNGEEVENILILKGTPNNETTTIQEGTKFRYLDGKLNPEGLTFNMNSILGSMNISQTEALPAYIVKVKFDKTYIIGRGKSDAFYTPCRECAPDSWFREFMTHPSSSNGTGLQALGYSTARDNYSNSNNYANYEDTHFGRACYVPPTMLPWSHMKYSSAQAQRLARLKTQAALYINGYQKDWYGFNYGALIGSFDGVTWFAIGTSRRVTATSNRLYLAINAPFADLAEVSEMPVHIIEDRGGNTNTAADFDYDPNLGRGDARQNQGASCQYFHKCETDRDCITNLGWEYTCAETYSLKTNWPKFDQDAKEEANISETKNFSELLQSKQMPSGDTKRCVYRGAGAPCITDYSTLSTSLKKAYTCAPNFYCAKLNEAVFNQDISRLENILGNVKYGMEADVLGRPKNYVMANNTLPTSDVIAALKSNATTQSPLFDNSKMGLCRPGKAIDNSITGNAYVDFHQNSNTSKITDYMNQIGGCSVEPTPLPATGDKPSFAFRKVVSCPAVDPTGNYFYYTKSSVATPTATEQNYFLTQNSCGAELIKPTPTTPKSPFYEILKAPITSSSLVIDSPAFAANACFRRAGSICHSDYDCTPNKLFSDKANLLPQSYFGNVAEHNYWKEYLVCGQAKDIPFISSPDYNNYNLNENRCCRPNGETLTMYSGKIGSAVNPENFPSYNMGSMTKYSRYTINSDLWIDPNGGTLLNRAAATATASVSFLSGKSPKPSFPIGTQDYFATPATVPDSNALAPFQWKTINDTGNKSCCGTWIRKFADGTHVWKDHYKKINFDVQSFSCLNYSNVVGLPYADMLANTTYLPSSLPTWADNSPRYNAEKSSMCLLQNPSSTAGGTCSQAAIASGVPGGKLQPPMLNPTASPSTIDTYFHTYTNNQTSYVKSLTNFVPYFLKPANITGITKTYSEFAVPATKNRLDVYLPPYIDGMRNVNELSLIIACDNGNTELSTLRLKSIYSPHLVMNNDNFSCLRWNYFGNTSDRPGLLSVARTDAGNINCFANGSTDCATPTTNVTMVKGIYDNDKDGCNEDANVTVCNADQTLSAFLRITFNRIGHPDHILSDGSMLAGSITNGSAAVNYTIGSAPGSDIYYENKLTRFELTGIPQVVFEPLYCNSNHAELVPGLFKATSPSLKMRSDVQLDQATCYYNNKFFNDPYIASNLSKSDPTNAPMCVTNSDNVAIPPQFSANEFVCCVPLGTTASSDDKCCSSFRDKTGICKLPSKTDLYLYLNKFVSGEGMEKKDMPGGGLKDSEFDPRTGFPKLTSEVYNKIKTFGAAYCETGATRMGGAFGKFAGEPKHPTAKQLESPPYSIVDSVFDEDTTSGDVPVGDAQPDVKGFETFTDGYRWVSHVYCK